MTASKAFLDTNVLLYAISDHSGKSARAEQLLSAGGAVSVQVLAEFVDVARRKFGVPWPTTMEMLASIGDLCAVVDLTVETHSLGLQVARDHGYRIYDGMIVAAALLAGCRVLCTEDLQDGQVIDGLTIRNPFAGL